MKSLAELTSTTEPAVDLIREWASKSETPIEILPPSPERASVLLDVQVTTHSVLGAVAYETGGIIVDGGWLRLLGSGHDRMRRTLPRWNSDKADGLYLVADDAIGGFFALNGGAFGPDRRRVYYFAPDTLTWEPMEGEYSQFVLWCTTGRMAKYYENFRWRTWREDVVRLHGDRCYQFSPPLWTSEGSPAASHRDEIPVEEVWGLAMDMKRQLGGGADDEVNGRT